MLLGFSPEVLHDHHEEELCTNSHENEQVDACHISVQHGIHKCQDHDHFKESNEACPLCDLVVGQYWLFQQSIDQAAIRFNCSVISLVHGSAKPITNLKGNHLNRGPPQFT